MKPLIIGFITFLIWSAGSTHIYVCKIKGLCPDTETIFVSTISVKNVLVADSLTGTLADKPEPIPDNLLIYFAFDKSEFNSSSVSKVYFNESNAYILKNPKARLIITGHTDSFGTDEYNQALGYRRALNVRKLFESNGLKADRITIGSMGEKEPAENNNSTIGRTNNRRAVITIKN